MSKLIMIGLLLCVFGCTPKSNDTLNKALQGFCKGCNGKMAAELVVGTWNTSFKLKCDNFILEASK
jgi:hypothetical protein